MRGRHFVCCALIMVLVACGKREKLTDSDCLKIKIQTARLSDFPVPLGAKPVLDLISDNSFGYLVSDVELDLLKYYTVEMDQYGWSLVGAFDSVERVLIFEKPHKLASIIIRKQGKHCLVLILTADK